MQRTGWRAVRTAVSKSCPDASDASGPTCRFSPPAEVIHSRLPGSGDKSTPWRGGFGESLQGSTTRSPTHPSQLSTYFVRSTCQGDRSSPESACSAGLNQKISASRAIFGMTISEIHRPSTQPVDNFEGPWTPVDKRPPKSRSLQGNRVNEPQPDCFSRGAARPALTRSVMTPLRGMGRGSHTSREPELGTGSLEG